MRAEPRERQDREDQQPGVGHDWGGSKGVRMGQESMFHIDLLNMTRLELAYSTNDGAAARPVPDCVWDAL